MFAGNVPSHAWKAVVGLLVALYLSTPSFASARPHPPRSEEFDPMPASEAKFDVGQPEDEIVEANGISLHYQVFKPVTREGGEVAPARTPTVLLASAYALKYAAEGQTKAAAEHTATLRDLDMVDHLVPRGYSFVVLDVRGSGRSGGCNEFYSRQQADDISQVIMDIVEQPWNDGHVGMYGSSDSATYALSQAAFGLPDAKAHLDAVVGAAVYTSPMQLAGIDSVPLPLGASASISGYDVGFAAPIPGGQPTGRTDCVAGNHTAAKEYDETGSYSGFWAERDIKPEAPNITTPVLLTRGIADGNVVNSTMDGFFDRLPKTTPHKLLIGQWGHGAPHNAPEKYRRTDWLDMVTAWFDQFLKGRDLDVEDWPQVQVQDVDGGWREERHWPDQVGSPAQLALSPAGLTMTPELGPIIYNETDSDASTAAVLVYEVPEGETLHLTGQPVADLFVSTSANDGHVAVTLQAQDKGEDHPPLGTIAYGARSLRHLKPIEDGIYTQSQIGRFTPGDRLHVAVRLTETDLVVPGGGRLVMTISGWTMNTATPLSPSGTTGEVSVLTGCDTPSMLRFEVVKHSAKPLQLQGQTSPSPVLIGDGGGTTGEICGESPIRPELALE